MNIFSGVLPCTSPQGTDDYVYGIDIENDENEIQCRSNLDDDDTGGDPRDRFE